MLITQSETLEQIEQLQSMLIGSVTDGESDTETYKKLRAELFELPNMKESLPSFVRTCADLNTTAVFENRPKTLQTAKVSPPG
jgi:hypothetical protein